MKLSKHKEVLVAIQNKLPLKDAEVWVHHDFNLYKATDYFLGFVPNEVSGEIKTLNMRAQDVTEFFASFRVPSLAIGWAKLGLNVDTAKSWSHACFNPSEASEWAKQGFSPKDTRLWSYAEIDPELCRKLREQSWSKEKASQWGPFKDWSVMKAASSWRKEGTTTKDHMNIGYKKISIEEWNVWRNVTSLAEAAAWIDKKFTPTTAAP
ncbi:hypothetical protein DSO57_1018842 [Entomophthora muscae]|uniref:Uncharacterized protein n=1 Tax=Entomophthora muscae TaxID=34485 RepID=A0ACC2UDN5_9FUNG|nr:hypothetical protein DSO57_1018842 [Entomophthora muscae]